MTSDADDDFFLPLSALTGITKKKKNRNFIFYKGLFIKFHHKTLNLFQAWSKLKYLPGYYLQLFSSRPEKTEEKPSFASQLHTSKFNYQQQMDRSMEMDPMEEGSSLDSLISSFNDRVADLKDLTIARNCQFILYYFLTFPTTTLFLLKMTTIDVIFILLKYLLLLRSLIWLLWISHCR